jgi:hypothetical protein
MTHAMRIVYRVLAYLICLIVALQAAAIALSFFGLITWVGQGGTLDKAFMESENSTFTGVGGLAFHGMVGIMIVPIIGLLLLISSFFTKSKNAILWAGIVLGAIVVQVLLGMFAHGLYMLGGLHGLFAFALFVCAAIAAHKITRVDPRRGRPADSAVAANPKVDVG